MFCCFSLCRTTQKGNQGAEQNRLRIGAYRVVQTHPYAHDFAPPLGFLFVWRDIEKNNKKRFIFFLFFFYFFILFIYLFIIYFIQTVKIHTECVC